MQTTQGQLGCQRTTMSKAQINAIILAGGSGSRLWPMSRQNLPRRWTASTSLRAGIFTVYQSYLEEAK